jgi:hypothetical protein
MSPEMNGLVIACMAYLIVIAISQARRTRGWRSLWLELAALVLFAIFLNVLLGFPFPSGATAKGPNKDLIVASALYICMVAGMLSQYLYRHLERPRTRRLKWDWGLFLAPVFASPIIFIPLLAAFQNNGLDFNSMAVPRLMIFFVAFQNGFFWKEFFDQKRKDEATKS